MNMYLNNSYKRLLVCGTICVSIGVSAFVERSRLIHLEERAAEVASHNAQETFYELDALNEQEQIVDNVDGTVKDEIRENVYDEEGNINDSELNLVSKEPTEKNAVMASNNVKEEKKSLQIYKREEKYNVPCEYVYDDNIMEGELVTTQDAQEGTRVVSVLASYKNGMETDSVPIDTEIIEEAVPMVIHVGTKRTEWFICPVDGYVVSSEFGPRWGTNHMGIDLAVAEGTPVVASMSGTVLEADWNGGYGINVYIEHDNGMCTRYAHLSGVNVCVGQVVGQGEVVGYSGNTGNSTGPHLHFETRVNGEAEDPRNYVDFY